MNIALLENMADSEFLRVVRDGVTTELERMLIDRMESGDRHSASYEARIDQLEDELDDSEADAASERLRVLELEGELDDIKGFARQLLDALHELCPEHELIEKQSEFAL